MQRWIVLPRLIAIGLIRVYKLVISPLLPSACRFHPTCSDYMKGAIEKHGVVKGLGRGLRRLSRCHPFHEGGFDPVR
jgi:putative membrane protein insertion efficiency factor